MARTVGQIITSARGILQDQRVPYRVSDADLAGYVTEAVSEARRVRPDFFARTFRQVLPVYTAASLATTVPLPDQYFVPMVNYVAGRADLREDEFAQDNRALTLIQAFGAALIGGAR